MAPFVTPHHGLLAALAGCVLVAVATTTATPLLYRAIINDGVIAGDRTVVTHCAWSCSGWCCSRRSSARPGGANDVLAVQAAFSSTLPTLLQNLLGSVVVAVVMVGLSWQVALAALGLVPAFVLAAVFAGRRQGRLATEAAAATSELNTRMTERFSARA